jgi:hypothetical protein
VLSFVDHAFDQRVKFSSDFLIFPIMMIHPYSL